MYRTIMRYLGIALLLLLPTVASAQEQTHVCLKVGVHEFPGFVEHHGGASYHGYAIDLFDEVMNRLDSDQCYNYVDLPEFGKIFTEQVPQGVVDVAVGAFSLTSERDEVVDFSHGFENAGLGILVKGTAEQNLGTIWNALFTGLTLKALGLFLAFLVGGGLFIYLSELLSNEGISNKFWLGWYQGICCAFDISSTVGFGRLEPRTIPGRLVAIVVFISGAIFVGVVIGQVSSAITIAELEHDIQSPADLRGRVVAVKKDSSGATEAKEFGARVLSFDSREEAAQAVIDGKAEAMVYDRPYLQFVVNTFGANEVAITGPLFAPQDYAYAFPPDSNLREPFNRVLLSVLEDNSFAQELREPYFGK